MEVRGALSPRVHLMRSAVPPEQGVVVEGWRGHGGWVSLPWPAPV